MDHAAAGAEQASADRVPKDLARAVLHVHGACDRVAFKFEALAVVGVDEVRVVQVAEEIDARFAPIPIVLVGTGLRPEELFALERRDLDLDAGVLSVERVYTQGALKDCRKSSRLRRRVPLRSRVVEALRALPPRIDTPLVFPAARGGHIDIEKFRYRHWTPALRAAGLDNRRVYDCRHTFASWAIAGGVQLFYLARIMGTSVQQIDQTYGHLLPDSEDYLRGLLDDYDGVYGLKTDLADGSE